MLKELCQALRTPFMLLIWFIGIITFAVAASWSFGLALCALRYLALFLDQTIG